MTLEDAKEGAQSVALDCGMPVAIVREGPHADEFAEHDTDGHSYGYCPAIAVDTLYRHGTVVGVVTAAFLKGGRKA